jgi:hypothetical protein
LKNSSAGKSHIGFLPCFSKYEFARFPYERLYGSAAAVAKVKQLMSDFVDSNGPQELHGQGVGKGGITAIRPNSKDAKKLIELFSFPYQIYRVDYGDTKFRVIFGLSSSDGKRIAYVLAFDMNHETFG